MAITHRDVGKWVTLRGKSKHGKNRVNQHGSDWLIEEVAVFQGQPAMRLKSKNETFSVRARGNSHEEWTSHKMHDGRWVLLRDDPNFIYFH